MPAKKQKNNGRSTTKVGKNIARRMRPQDWKLGLAIATQLGSAKLKVQKTRTARPQAMTVMSTAPVNPGLSTTVAPSFSVSRSPRFKDAIVITGQERISAVNVVASSAPGTQLVTLDINPKNIGSRLPQFAQLYRKYIFKSINFQYVPNATAFTAGANTELMMAMDYDPSSTDVIPSDVLNVDDIFAWEGSVAGSAIGAIRATLKRLDPDTEFYVDDDGGENRLVTQARYFLVNSSTPAATAELGVLFCTYVVELFIPHVVDTVSTADSNIFEFMNTNVRESFTTDITNTDWEWAGLGTSPTVVHSSPNFIIDATSPLQTGFTVAPGGVWRVFIRTTLNTSYSASAGTNDFCGVGAYIDDFSDASAPDNNNGPSYTFNTTTPDITILNTIADHGVSSPNTIIHQSYTATAGAINDGFWQVSGWCVEIIVDTSAASTPQGFTFSLRVDEIMRGFLNLDATSTRDSLSCRMWGANFNVLGATRRSFVKSRDGLTLSGRAVLATVPKNRSQRCLPRTPDDIELVPGETTADPRANRLVGQRRPLRGRSVQL